MYFTTSVDGTLEIRDDQDMAMFLSANQAKNLLAHLQRSWVIVSDKPFQASSFITDDRTHHD